MPEIQGVEVGPNQYWPLIAVEFQVDGPTNEFLSMIDSGADSTIIPGEFLTGHPTLQYDDLPVSKGLAGGAGGSFETRKCPGSASWRDVTFCTELLAAQPGALPHPLLGRNDFFQKFIVRFNWNRTPPSMRIDEVTGKKF